MDVFYLLHGFYSYSYLAFSVFFLERYYQSAKIRDITDAANQIIQAYGTDQQEVTNRSLAFDNSLCIVITDEMGNPLVMENNMGAYSHLNKVINKGYGIGLFKMISQLKQSDDNYITKIAQNENFKSKEIFTARLSTLTIRISRRIFSLKAQ